MSIKKTMSLSVKFAQKYIKLATPNEDEQKITFDTFERFIGPAPMITIYPDAFSRNKMADHVPAFMCESTTATPSNGWLSRPAFVFKFYNHPDNPYSDTDAKKKLLIPILDNRTAYRGEEMYLDVPSSVNYKTNHRGYSDYIAVFFK